MKVERCENHPEGVKPLIAMGETHGKERAIAISLGAGSFLEDVGLCRGWKRIPKGKWSVTQTSVEETYT